MFDIILTVVIFHSLAAVALFVVYALSSRENARRLVADAQLTSADTTDYSASYSHS